VRSPAFQRYTALCVELHDREADLQDDIRDAWLDLPLRTRLRVILTVPWRDAVTEVAASFRQRQSD
jgi:hypothetical protein